MDTALKHRLTGAILLVVIAVLLLPELLTGAGDAPRAVSDTGGSTDVPVRRYDIDLTERAEAPPEVASPEVAPPAELAPVPPVEPAPESPAARPESAPEVAASPPPAEPPAATEPVASTGYVVQVGVFSSRAGADRVAKTLRGKGFTVTVSRYDSGKRLYRVRVGPPAERAEARRLRERLAAAGHPGTVVAEGVESRSP